ncbi:hypothetical protein C7S16_1508 [Burkholderia thailandensis]|uniref:Uncharacterized protein n=1 Tax=Burkholderia thailandensis TaxID=57975 RepID=A0AAW9D1P0_BURTH|nr:hypothetical protein [Burkholderia thailandensis]MDW9256332.1 hypothetical protein [Burkholderia thailandensis]
MIDRSPNGTLSTICAVYRKYRSDSIFYPSIEAIASAINERRGT